MIILIHSVLVHWEEILGVNGQLIDKQMNKIPQTRQTTTDALTKVNCSVYVAKCSGHVAKCSGHVAKCGGHVAKCGGHVAKSYSTPVINKRLLNLQEVRK